MAEIPQLSRVLGLRDVVLLNVAAVVSLRWISNAAQIGPSSLSMWTIGLVTFLIPLGIAVTELSSRYPDEGGLYVWSKHAFGDMHGFITGWSYWVSNLTYFPSLLLFSAGVFVHIGGWDDLATSTGFNLLYGSIALWGATLLNIVGLERAKWIHNIGGIATWITAVLVVVAGALAWSKYGSATELTPSTVLPDLGSLPTWVSLSAVSMGYVGFELGPILGGEIREPERVVPRAILIASICIAVVYIAGTAAVLIALPHEQIDVIGGIPQALAAIGERLGVPMFGAVTALLIVMSTIGGLGGYMSGTARLPFIVGVDRYLPRALGRLHPRYGTPWVALLTQGTVSMIILVAALSGSTIREAFVVLVDMTSILTMVALMYLFAAVPVLCGRTAKMWLVGGVGFATTLLAAVMSMVPPADANAPLFIAKVVGGAALCIGVGLVFFLRGRALTTGGNDRASGRRPR